MVSLRTRTHRVVVSMLAALLVAAGCSSGGSDGAQSGAVVDRSSETTLVSGEPEGAAAPAEEDKQSVDDVAPDDPEESGDEASDAEPIEWTPCGKIECATFAVPADHADPDGPTIDLALSRVPSTADEPIGTLFINFGGPGAETGEILASDSFFYEDYFGQSFHVVGWDPRGTGESARLACDDAALYESVDFTPTDPSDGFEDEVGEAEQFFELLSGCALDSGDIIDDLSTSDAARDLDLLRQAVGDEQLSYLGYSYGTQIGWVYATLFPENTRALVLDGAVPAGAFGAEGVVRWFEAAERALVHFDEVCDREPTCLARDEGFVERVDRIIATLEAAPIPLSDGTDFDDGDFVNGVFSALYLDPFSIGADLDQWMVEILDESDPSGLIDFAVAGDTSTPGAFEAVACADGGAIASPAEYEAHIAELLEASPRFGRAPLPLICDAWPGEVDPLPPIDTTGSAPILVIGNTYDPATPYEDAVTLTEQLADAVLLTFDGAGHTVFGFDPCVDGVVLDYLIDLVVIEDGLECRPSSGFVGVLIEPNDEGAIVVLDVTVDSAAEAAGFAVGDIITAIDGVPVTSLAAVGPFTRGELVTFDINRDGTLIQLPVTPTGQPWT